MQALIVNEDPHLRATLTKIFAKIYPMWTVINKPNFKELSPIELSEFSLIIVDLYQFNNPESLKKLKKNAFLIGMDDLLNPIFEEYVDAFLKKPFFYENLIQIIQSKFKMFLEPIQTG